MSTCHWSSGELIRLVYFQGRRRKTLLDPSHRLADRVAVAAGTANLDSLPPH